MKMPNPKVPIILSLHVSLMGFEKNLFVLIAGMILKGLDVDLNKEIISFIQISLKYLLFCISRSIFDVVLMAMERYTDTKKIQYSCTASLYFIVKVGSL